MISGSRPDLAAEPLTPCLPSDKRVKVSLFLQEGIQSSSGRLILPSPNGAKVGTVTTFTPSGSVNSQDKIKMKSQQVGGLSVIKSRAEGPANHQDNPYRVGVL